jgi:hypothetical protein
MSQHGHIWLSGDKHTGTARGARLRNLAGQDIGQRDGAEPYKQM